MPYEHLPDGFIRRQEPGRQRPGRSFPTGVVVFVVLVLFAVFIIYNFNGENSTTETTEASKTNPQPKSQVCTVLANTKGGLADGTVYSVGFGDRLKTRGTIDKRRKTKVTINFLVNKQTVYIWNASYNQGVKFPFKVKSVNQIFIHNLVKEFNCKDWILDNSLFEVPKNINFELMKGDVSSLDWLLL